MKKRLFSFVMALAMMVGLTAVMPVSIDSFVVNAANFSDFDHSGSPADQIAKCAEAQVYKTQSEMGYSFSWCAAFVSDCAKQIGQESAIPYNSVVNGLYTAVINAGGQRVSEAQRGDLVFYYCTICNSYTHVGIMISSNTKVDGNNWENGYSHVYSGSDNYTDSSGHSTNVGTINKIYVRPNYSGNIIDNIGDDFYAYIENDQTKLFLTNQKNNVAGETPTGNANQIWHFIRNSNGSYRIESYLDKGYLDVLGMKDEDAANVYVYSSYTGAKNQNFYITAKYGSYYIRPAISSSRNLDMQTGTNTAHNLEIWVEGQNWGPQKFNIIKVGVDGNFPVNIGDDFYASIENQSTGLYLTNQQNNIAGQTRKCADNQVWHFTRLSNGAYKIQSKLNNYVMDVLGPHDEDDTNVYAYKDYVGGLNQQFYIYYMYGAYYFRPAFTQARMLDMETTGSHNLELWIRGKDWAPQEFNINKLTENIGEHNYEVTVITPTAEAKGYTHHKCTICGDEFDDSFVDPIQEEPITFDIILNANDKAMSSENVNISINGEEASTSDNGSAELSLADGTHELTFSAPDFVTRTYKVTVKGGAIVEDITPELNLIGDITGDGKLNAADLLRAKSHIKGVGLLTGYELKCADIDGNGKVNAADLLKLKAHIKGVTKLW